MGTTNENEMVKEETKALQTSSNRSSQLPGSRKALINAVNVKSPHLFSHRGIIALPLEREISKSD